MASVTHIAAGAVCAAVYARRSKSKSPAAALALTALALSPDLDLIALELGAGGTPLDHRVLTHSLVFAGVVGSAFGSLLARPPHRLLAAALSALALATHGLLDAMTAHGPGPQLLWPLSTVPIQFAWHPIPGASSYRQYFTPEAAPVLASEAVICLSLLALAVVVWRGAATTRRSRP